MSYSKIKNMISHFDIDTVREWSEKFHPNGLSILDAAANLYLDNPEDVFICGGDDIDDWKNEIWWGEPEEVEDYIQSYNGWWFMVEMGPC